MTVGLPAFEQERVVVVCGDVSPHQKLGTAEFWAACGLTLVRCSENPASVSSLCDKLKPSLLIAKQSFLENPAPLLTGILRPGGRIFVLAIVEDPSAQHVINLLRLGCRGVLPQRLSARLLRRAVETTLRGELWAPRALISALLVESLSSNSLRQDRHLTARQQRILELAGQGYKNSEIATVLFISQETVRWHKRRLYRKIPVGDVRMRVSAESRKSALQVPGRCAG